MKSHIFAVLAVTLAIGSESNASILSASSQAVREPSAKAVESWNATALQQDLNASLRDAAEATTLAGPLASKRAPIAGGFMVNDGAASRATYVPFGETAALNDLFRIERNPGTKLDGLFDTGGPVTAGHDRGSPYATPEPSTSVLLVSGLLLLGAYGSLRRRGATNA
jgi:hypothetical protein